MKTVEETKKTKEDQVELKNVVKENTANTPEGAIPDDAAEAVAGGYLSERSKPEFLKVKVQADPTLTKDRR